MRTGFFIVVEAPRYSVAAVAFGGGVQRSFSLHQRGFGIIRCRNHQRLFPIDLAQLIAEVTVLAI